MTANNCSDPMMVEFVGSQWKLLFQGAESKVFEGEYDSKSAIWKERFQKKYRLPELDKKLTKERIKAEIRSYEKIKDKCKILSEKMSSILYADDRNIIFSRIENSISLSQYITKCELDEKPELIKEILIQLAELISNIHSIGLIHGDLTTSNFLVQNSPDNPSIVSIVPIDFGLSYSSKTDENRAVDLYVLERAIQSTHPTVDFDIFLDEYKKKMATDKINKKLDEVRMRGRKRSMVG